MSSARIGVDNLVYALLTKDGGTVAPTYSAPISLPGVMKLNINPNPSSATLFADDGPMESAASLGKIEVEIDKAFLTMAEKTAILGHGADTNGVVIYGAADVSPYLALGFRTLRGDGTYRYVWMLKGRFMEPEDNNETKGDSVKFQNDTIKGEFVKINKEYTVGSKTTKPWKTEVDADVAAAASTIGTWFSSPYLPVGV